VEKFWRHGELEKMNFFACPLELWQLIQSGRERKLIWLNFNEPNLRKIA